MTAGQQVFYFELARAFTNDCEQSLYLAAYINISSCNSATIICIDVARVGKVKLFLSTITIGLGILSSKRKQKNVGITT